MAEKHSDICNEVYSCLINWFNVRYGCILRKDISYFKGKIFKDGRWDGSLFRRIQRGFG